MAKDKQKPGNQSKLELVSLELVLKARLPNIN